MKILACLMFCAKLVSANADSPVSELQLSKELNLYQNLKTLKVDFIQNKTIKDMGVTLKSSGIFLLSRPEKKMVWEVLKPSHLKVTMGEKDIRIQNANAQEQIYKTGEISQSQNGPGDLTAMVAWLNLDAKALIQEYEIQQIDKENFRFKPKSLGKSPFQTLSMTLDQKKHVKKLLLSEKSGDQIEIKFGTPVIK